MPVLSYIEFSTISPIIAHCLKEGDNVLRVKTLLVNSSGGKVCFQNFGSAMAKLTLVSATAFGRCGNSAWFEPPHQ